MAGWRAPLVAALAALALLAGGAGAESAVRKLKPKLSKHLSRDEAQVIGRTVWVLKTGERGVIRGFGFSPENSAEPCFPFPDRPDNGGCVEVEFGDGVRLWFGPDPQGFVYKDLTLRPMDGDALTDPSVSALNRNAADQDCRDYVKMVLDPKRDGESLEWFKARKDRQCHNEYLGSSWNPRSGGLFALRKEEAAAYRRRLVALASKKMSPAAAAYLRENALLGFVTAFDGELAAEEGSDLLPAYWGLFLVRPHSWASVQRLLQDSDPVERLEAPASDEALGSETFAVYGVPGRSDRHHLRLPGPKKTATVLGGGLELGRRFLADVAPEHQEAVVGLLAAMERLSHGPAAQAGNLLPYHGRAGVLNGAEALFRAYHEKAELVGQLGAPYEQVKGAMARPLAALTLYATERTGRLMGHEADTAMYRQMLQTPFEQLVYITDSECPERVPVASYHCQELAGACGAPSVRVDDPAGVACSWEAALSRDSNRYKRFESSASCAAKRRTGKGSCATPRSRWFELPVPRQLPPALDYLERYGYFEFDAARDAQVWQRSLDLLAGVEVPPAVRTPSARAGYRLVYSALAGLGAFLASDDGGLGLHMNVGPRASPRWGNWNIRCTDPALWQGRAEGKAACETGYATPAWNDIRATLQTLQSALQVTGVSCRGAAPAFGKGAKLRNDDYVRALVAAVRKPLERVMDEFFGMPASSFRVRADRPTFERNVLLVKVRGAKGPIAGKTVTRLCPSRDSAVCKGDEVRDLVEELDKLRETPMLGAQLREKLPLLREKLGVALRFVFRTVVGPAIEEAGFPEVAALATELPRKSVIPDGGDKSEADADAKEAARATGIPADDASSGGADSAAAPSASSASSGAAPAAGGEVTPLNLSS